MEDEGVDSEDITRMFAVGKQAEMSDEQLAMFMRRFNIDRDTLETMPAFEEHCKVLFNREISE